MKCVLVILTSAFSTCSFGQEIKGTIIFTKENYRLHTVWVSALNMDNSTDMPFVAESDSLGRFRLAVQKSGHYQMSVVGFLEPDTTFSVSVGQNEVLDLSINYPPKICPYEKARFTGLCPEGNHKEMVIPIAYGLIEDRKFWKKVERNEVIPGGCIVTDCDPNWYCKKHNKRF